MPYDLSDLLLRLADAQMYEPLWSAEILDEVRRHVPDSANSRVDRMARAFPLAAVEGYVGLMSAMTNHEKDRHVLAAAVRGDANLIVTANLRDFPEAALVPYGIEAVHPDDFLLDQLDLDPERVLQVLVDQRGDYTRPELQVEEFYRTLALVVPGFATAAAATEAASSDPKSPLPMEIVESEEARDAFFPDGQPSPATPRGAACLWWAALLHKEEAAVAGALQALSVNPADWGADYGSAATSLDGWAMMQFVEPCPDAPENIAYAKFIPDTGHSMRGCAAAPLQNVKILTVVRCPDELSRVWGLSDDNYRPSAARVYGAEEV